MPTYTVTTLADNSSTPPVGSLRAAIISANLNPGSTINFSVSGTITLTGRLPLIIGSITIDGSGQSIIIDGDGAYNIFVFYSSLTSDSVTINNISLNNAFVNSGENGAAICFGSDNIIGQQNSYNTYLTVYGCSFYNNTATNGSAIETGAYNTYITNSTFVGNSCVGGVGTLFVTASGSVTNTCIVTNCTFSGNTSTYSTHLEYNSTIFVVSPNIVSIKNCIMFDETNVEISQATGTVTYSDIKGGYVGVGNINTDPLLGTFQSNNGPTPTMALGNGSPCLGTGTITGAPANDQRGFARQSPPSMGSWDRIGIGAVPIIGASAMSAVANTKKYSGASIVGDALVSAQGATCVFGIATIVGTSRTIAQGNLLLSGASAIAVSVLSATARTKIFGGVNIIGATTTIANGIDHKFSGSISVHGVGLFDTNTTPTPIFSNAYTSNDGTAVYAVFWDSTSSILYPASPTNVPGFSLNINGTSYSIYGVRKGTSGVDAVTFTLTLPINIKIYSADIITISYYPQSPAIVNHSLPPAGVPQFVNKPVVNYVTLGKNQWFDPIAWLSTTSPPPGADLFEWRIGYPTATVQISTTAPTGYVILNEDTTSGGIDIHHWKAYTAPTVVPAYYDVLMDAQDNTIRQATNFGESVSEGEFEAIGYGSAQSLVKYFTPTIVSNVATYPSITIVEIGATALNAKKYVLEFKASPSDTWHAALAMIADNRTRPYFRFALSVATAVFAVRMRYLGDYYASSNNGTLTVTGFDSAQPLSAIQISRYPDFRDATDFSQADPNTGWINFSQGTSRYNWQLENVKRVWTPLENTVSSAFSKLLPVSSFMVGLTTDNNICTIDTLGNVVEISNVIPDNTSVTSSAVYQANLYIGLSNGSVLQSITGISYTTTNIVLTDPVNSSITPATAMFSYRNQLFIGTSAATPTGNAYLYSWNGTSITTIRKFNQPYITTMTVMGAYLYVGLGGTVGSGVGQVWMYDGATWQLTHTPSIASDRAEVVQYSTEDATLWAAYQGGYIYSAALTVTGQVATSGWSVRYSCAATNFYDLVDDPDGSFLWIPSDISTLNVDYLYLPVGSAPGAVGTFASAPCPQPEFPGLQAQFYNSTFEDYNIPTTGTLAATIIDTAVNWTDFTTYRPNGVNSLYWNARWTGYIWSDITETYTFYLNADSNCDMYINGTLVIDGLNDGYPGTERSGSVVLVAEQWTQIRIDYTRGSDSSAFLELKWSSASINKSLVPSRNLTYNPNPISIKDIALFNGNWYGACSDGKIYVLDTTAVISENRRVYIKYQDSSGNITDATIFNTSTNFNSVGEPISIMANQIGVLYDSIIQGVEVVNGVSVSNPSIHQIELSGSPAVTSIVTTFESPNDTSMALYAPSRTVRSVGTFESDPYFVATLTSWSNITILVEIPAGTPSSTAQGLDYGTSVQVFARSANTLNDCLAASWVSLPTPVMSSINNSSGAIPTAAAMEFNIQNFSGTWIQYQLVLSTATANISPIVNMVNISYDAANASYFFTNVFNTANMSNQAANPPLFERGLLTANYVPNGGIVTFGYTIDETPGNRFDFSNHYTTIEPNTVFTITNSSGVTTPSQNIRFGVLLVSLGDGIGGDPPPAIVYDIGVMLDAGTANLQWMSGTYA